MSDSYKTKKNETSSSEWTPQNGLVVSGEMSIQKSPSYIRLDGYVAVHKTILAGITPDGRKVLLDVDGNEKIVGIEIV